MSESASNRRDFLTGRSVRTVIENAGRQFADEIIRTDRPSRGPTLMLRTTAMACDFDVMVNPDGPATQLEAASTALGLVHELEQQFSVYRDDSELSQLNRRAAHEPATVEAALFDLLERARSISEQTDGAFDPASGALIQLWKRCRNEDRIPTSDEIERSLAICGISNVTFNAGKREISFNRPGIEFNLGAIGKGYAVEQAGECLMTNGVSNWLVHGGRSSIRAAGIHAGHDGWPVGLQNPLVPDKPFATILLKNAALATSGTAVQWFRHQGRRFGHILDVRTGWPVETLLSVSVIASDSALADALSTAFFVLGVEKSLQCCDNLPNSVGVIFFPLPKHGQTLEPILHNVSPEIWFTG
jgi:FAD:protein FMN transferase